MARPDNEHKFRASLTYLAKTVLRIKLNLKLGHSTLGLLLVFHVDTEVGDVLFEFGINDHVILIFSIRVDIGALPG